MIVTEVATGSVGLSAQARSASRTRTDGMRLRAADCRVGKMMELASPFAPARRAAMFFSSSSSHVMLVFLGLVLMRHGGESTSGNACEEAFALDFHPS